MYFQLGDIKFEALIGFESFTDTVEAVYAQHDLINRKPKLQRTGDTLREFSGTIHFHSSFCVPEDEYFKLETKRVSGEALPLIYGNGRYEGDYYLKSITRTPNQTTPSGDYVSLNCSIVLIESDTVLSPSQREAQAKTSAFALTSNRPLPVGTSVNDVNNPALSVMNENKNASQGANKMADYTSNVDKKIADVASPIPAAQKFKDMSPVVISKMTNQVNQVSDALDAITSLLSANPLINSVSPDLNNQVNASKASLIAIESVIADVNTLPSVNTLSDAIYVLNVQKNTVISAQQLVTQLSIMNSAATGVAGAIATKQKVTT